ncbi:hypothetical protein QQS21_006886 [Conoideocrella luteorostrata]|uniref:Uncharacterized protein n=1 Tax=Conoideocrella luteorostrata TaxID=1105319 RepID=A0AAJ0CMM9_9HYPO|nr:hypothetical protein QQS21_006886 [Conoideocrella luteorostrata]
MASTNQPKRRFAPVPIETTFQSNRRNSMQGGGRTGGPIPEPTPEPSPRSASPPMMPRLRQRRRFKPQLIETSRRTRRVGDPGPATRPADKTDITPYTNHIYVARAKPRRKNGETLDDEPIGHIPPTRRESEDESVKEYLLEIAAREASRQMEEVALAAFPNSRAREGGVAHFYFRENSDSDNSAEDTPQKQDDGAQPRVRRKSSNLGLNWWQKHMQNHAEQMAHERGGDEMELDTGEDAIMRTDSDLDKMDLPVPPDPLWTTTNRIAPEDRRDSMAEIQDLRNSLTPLARPDSTFLAGNRLQSGDAAFGRPSPDHQRDVGFSPIPRPVTDRNPDIGFGRPFGALGLKPDDPKQHLLRQAASPPMLGKDLAFRRCPSPKQTKLETDHPFFHNQAHKDHNRDTTGEGGLWRGYCHRSESNNNYVVPATLHGANMLVTPYPPASPRDAGGYDSWSMSEEPESTLSSSDSSDSLTNSLSPTRSEFRPKNGPSKGLHMLHGLDDRLRREKAQVERDEKIASEFGDEFITQVYNYLSLGYPAMARSFDEELSKISQVTVDDLCSHDQEQMAKGHMLEMKLEETPEEERCPRWKALRIYITEWARQHPNLDNLDPLAWGVRERRGSWAI